MRMPLALLVAISLLLTGCFGGSEGQIEPAYYDIPGNSVANPSASGSASAAISPAPMLRLAGVQAPGWLMTPAMQYRLAYADASRRLSYAESRWAAPPAELLELALKRGNIVGDGRVAAGGCQLLVSLDEFIQVFDAPGSSRALLETRVALLAPRDSKLLAQRAFSQAPTAGTDARSGVAAFAVAMHDLNAQLSAWLVQLGRDSPESIERCRIAGL
jgi:cholesterol transport system auxiliary component